MSLRYRARLRGLLALLGVGLASLAIGTAAGAITVVDFEGFDNGAFIDTQYAPDLVISGENLDPSGGPDATIIFDSTLSQPVDRDLQGFAGGNLALGNLLIVPEDVIDMNGDDLVDQPNDEGSRPSARITFDFSGAALGVVLFGTDVVDVEVEEVAGTFFEFFDGMTSVGTVQLSEFLDSSSPFYDPSLVFGDATANRLDPISAADLGVDSFASVVVQLGGSAALDNVAYEFVPEPTTALMLAGGLAGLASLGRRRR